MWPSYDERIWENVKHAYSGESTTHDVILSEISVHTTSNTLFRYFHKDFLVGTECVGNGGLDNTTDPPEEAENTDVTQTLIIELRTNHG